MKKILISVIIALVCIFLVINLEVHAEVNWNSYINTVKNANSDTEVDNSTRKVVEAVLSITRTVGAGVAVIMIIVVAMKYMISAPGDRAEIKKHAIVYVTGAIILFASSAILGIIKDLFVKNI